MTQEALLEHLIAYAREFWDLSRCELIETSHEKTWWGGRRGVFVFDVGWPKARLALVVRERDGKVLDHRAIAHPTPRALLTPLSEEEAIEVARRECERVHYWFRQPVRASRHENGWTIHTNILCMGANATLGIDDTGVVIGRHFFRR
ncbi:MAG: hypothetical protein HYV09_14930 [Deltaproteobacteria bacterium]|nr:hypothetical protein [Deltaproteobacteria bacterium]